MLGRMYFLYSPERAEAKFDVGGDLSPTVCQISSPEEMTLEEVARDRARGIGVWILVR